LNFAVIEAHAFTPNGKEASFADANAIACSYLSQL
jgi:hypothetical protein